MDTAPPGTPVDIPGEHLARMLDLWCYGEEGAQIRYGDEFKAMRPRPLGSPVGYNSFMGNKSRTDKCGAPFHVPKEKESALCDVRVPARHFFERVWETCIVEAGTDEDKFDINYPFKCALDDSRLRVPTEAEPLNPDKEARLPLTNDQLGMAGQFWGVKRLHLNNKIRAVQGIVTKLCKLYSRQTRPPPASSPRANKKYPAIDLSYLRRVHQDFLCRDARATTLRDAMGRFLFRLSVFFLAQALPDLAANEHLSFVAREGKAQLNALVAAMFKNLPHMLVKVTSMTRGAGFDNAPLFKEVRAQGTSMYHFECGGIRKRRGLVDRRVSADFGVCWLCGKVVDCHQNASRNIASSHPDYDPPP